jgi:hypothetical protein
MMHLYINGKKSAVFSPVYYRMIDAVADGLDTAQDCGERFATVYRQ